MQAPETLRGYLEAVAEFSQARQGTPVGLRLKVSVSLLLGTLVSFSMKWQKHINP
jgi:hypothetical protein